MNAAIYTGTISHARHLPKQHAFSLPFFMYYLDLAAIDTVPDYTILFSTRRRALARFHRPDYYGDPQVPLYQSIKERMEEITGQDVSGKIYGLLNLRTLGLYFSPVNFYYGFNATGHFSHFLAEVSNIPWNERHQYGLYVADRKAVPMQQKVFKVSPFNPIDQQYQWNISAPGEELVVALAVHDARGHVFDASLQLRRRPLSFRSLVGQLARKPAMTAFIVAGIYWQALRLFIKGVPYVPYKKVSQ
jgi:DUF1365 family protein